MGLKKEYKLIIKTQSQTYKSVRMDLYGVCVLFLNHLSIYKSLDEYNKGDFIITYNPFTQEAVIKRYKLIVLAPYTEIEIKKLSSGTINPEDFMKSLEYIKESYYNERN